MKSRIWIATIFPTYFASFFQEGIAARAFKSDLFEVNIVDIRKYSFTKYKGVDDTPYGGGPGMVMRADVLKNALVSGVLGPGNYNENYKEQLEIVIPGPRGIQWNRDQASQFAFDFWGQTKKDLFFICGRYEGIDERFIEAYVDREISVGDFVLTGGELAVMTILDSAVRFVPGSLGNIDSSREDSFEEDLLEHPQYTKPRDFEGSSIPEILLSGHHANIKKYQIEERKRITKKYRPDLFKSWEKKNG